MDTQKLIMDKISSVLAATDKTQTAELKKYIDGAGRIFIAGAGRSKLVSSFLAMRLVHCGYQVSVVGEIVTPALHEGDLYIVISGSGGTKTLLPTLVTAKSKGAKIAVVSMKSSSAMAELADITVAMGNDEVFALTKGLPMGTSFELSTLVFLEALIGEIVFDKDLTEEGMRGVHANLE
jgi:6-phospho-3-hexuloisomerase